MVETGGHLSIKDVPSPVIRIMDVKCPASGESDKVEWTNIDRLGSLDQVKFVIQDRVDYEFAREAATRHALDRRCAAVLFSPVHGVLDPATLARWILDARIPVRLQIQTHKYIWDPETRGV